MQWNDMHIYRTILLGIWVFFFFYYGISKWRGWDEVYTSFIRSYIKKTIQELKGYRIGLSCTLNALIFFKNVFGLVLVFLFCLFVLFNDDWWLFVVIKKYNECTNFVKYKTTTKVFYMRHLPKVFEASEFPMRL